MAEHSVAGEPSHLPLFLDGNAAYRTLTFSGLHSQTMGDRGFPTWGDCENQVLPTRH